MPHVIHYSPQFVLDLNNMEEYIRDTLNQPSSAAEITETILDDIASILTDHPEAGHEYILPNGMDSGYRVLVHESISCKTFYQYISGEVFVVRAIHDRQDVMKIL